MTTLHRWWQQWLCGRSKHMPVIKRQDGKVWEACFICEARIGKGMDFTGFRGPRVAVGKPKSMREWRQKHGTRKAS